MNEKRPTTDHDILVRLDERQEGLIRTMDNHLKHHQAWTLALAAVLLAAILGMFFA